METNFAYLKTTMQMDVLRCKTVQGVLKELIMFALVYNLARLVMLAAAREQHVSRQRLSFVDALRWLAAACEHPTELELLVNAHRPGPLRTSRKEATPKTIRPDEQATMPRVARSSVRCIYGKHRPCSSTA